MNDSKSVSNVSVTAKTAAIPNLQPNQEYTVSVTAVGSFCTSDPATKNFISQAYGSMATTSTYDPLQWLHYIGMKCM